MFFNAKEIVKKDCFSYLQHLYMIALIKGLEMDFSNITFRQDRLRSCGTTLEIPRLQAWFEILN